MFNVRYLGRTNEDMFRSWFSASSEQTGTRYTPGQVARSGWLAATNDADQWIQYDTSAMPRMAIKMLTAGVRWVVINPMNYSPFISIYF